MTDIDPSVAPAGLTRPLAFLTPATGTLTSTLAVSDTDGDDEDPDEAPDWKAEAEKWQKLAKRNEARAAGNSEAAKELARLRESGMTDLEKAKNEGKAEALREAGSKLVRAEFRAACASRSVNVKALLEGIDETRFLDENGDPDTDRIARYVDNVAPATTDRVPPGRGGPRSTGEKPADMNDVIRNAGRRS